MSFARETYEGAGMVVRQPLRRVTPRQEREILRLMDAGVPHRAVASLYGVSHRNLYRIRDRAGRPAFEVVVGGYKAWFEISDLGPVQVTGWVPA
jgi:hypothetical protein